MALSGIQLKDKYGIGPVKKQSELDDIMTSIKADTGLLVTDVCLVRFGMASAAGLTKKTMAESCPDASLMDSVEMAVIKLTASNKNLGALVAAKIKAGKPIPVPPPTPNPPTPKPPVPNPPKPTPGKTPGKTPPSVTPTAVVQPGKPINWKPVLKWGGLLLAATGIGYFAWQKLQAR